jgi:hypothetical protein
MPSITSENLSQAIVMEIADQVLMSLMSRTVMAQLVNRDFENEFKGEGDTVSINIAPKMAANNIAETGTVQTQNPSMGKAEVVLDRHYESSFAVPDVTKVITKPDIVRVYSEEAVKALSRQMETDLLGLYPFFTFNTVQGASNTPLTEGVVDSAETALYKAEVPENERLSLVVSADAYEGLRQISRFSEAQTVGDGSAIRTGFVGKLKNFDVFRSNYVHKTSNTTHNLAFARDAIALVTRPMPLPRPGTGAIGAYAQANDFGVRIIMSYKSDTLAEQVSVDVLCGMADIRKEFGVQVES